MIKKVFAAILIVGVIGGFIGYSMITQQEREEQAGVPRNAFPVELEDSFIMTVVTDISVKGTVSFIDKHIVYPKSSAKIKTVGAKAADGKLQASWIKYNGIIV